MKLRGVKYLDGSYAADFDLSDGPTKSKRVWVLQNVSRSDENKAKAKELANQAVDDWRRANALHPSQYTMIMAMDEFLANRPRKRQHHHNAYVALAKHFDGFTGHKVLKDITKVDLRDWVASKVSASGSRRQQISIMRAVTRYLAQSYDDFNNPFRDYAMPARTGRNPHKRVWLAELAKLAADRNKLFGDLCVVLGFSGCRPSEILGLTGAEVDPDFTMLHLKDWKTKKAGNDDGGTRPVLSPASAILQERVAKYGFGILFPKTNGKPYTSTMVDKKEGNSALRQSMPAA